MLASATWTIVSVKKNYHTEIIYFQEYDYTCPTDIFNWTTQPLRVYCWDYNPGNVSNNTEPYYYLVFDSGGIDIARYNITTKTIWWNYTQTRIVDEHLVNITINKDGEIDIYQCSYPYHQCTRDGGVITCDSCLDGNCDGHCAGGESCMEINVSKASVADWRRIVKGYRELERFGITCGSI